MKYSVKIIETLSRNVSIEAEDKHEAFEKVSNMYAEGKIVLNNDDFSDVEMYVDEHFIMDEDENEI